MGFNEFCEFSPSNYQICEGDLGKNTKFALGVRSLGQIYHSGGRLVDPKK